MTELLTVDHLSVRLPYEGAMDAVVDGISFTVDRGESVGLVGESGSGKSITARSLIRLLPETAWTVAIDTAGTPRPIDDTGLPVAQIAELTGILGDPVGNGWPSGMRVLVRRERPHPGAQITLLEAHDGWRYQAAIDAIRAGRGWVELPA